MMRYNYDLTQVLQKSYKRIIQVLQNVRCRELHMENVCEKDLEVIGWQGLEPWTNGLKGRCSTN